MAILLYVMKSAHLSSWVRHRDKFSLCLGGADYKQFSITYLLACVKSHCNRAYARWWWFSPIATHKPRYHIWVKAIPTASICAMMPMFLIRSRATFAAAEPSDMAAYCRQDEERVLRGSERMPAGFCCLHSHLVNIPKTPLLQNARCKDFRVSRERKGR